MKMEFLAVYIETIICWNKPVGSPKNLSKLCFLVYIYIYIYKPSRQMGHLVYGRYFARHYSKKRNDRVNSRKIIRHLAHSPTWWFVPSLSYIYIYLYTDLICIYTSSQTYPQRNKKSPHVFFVCQIFIPQPTMAPRLCPLLLQPWNSVGWEPGDPAPKHLGYQTIWWYIQVQWGARYVPILTTSSIFLHHLESCCFQPLNRQTWQSSSLIRSSRSTNPPKHRCITDSPWSP